MKKTMKNYEYYYEKCFRNFLSVIDKYVNHMTTKMLHSIPSRKKKTKKWGRNDV